MVFSRYRLEGTPSFIMRRRRASTLACVCVRMSWGRPVPRDTALAMSCVFPVPAGASTDARSALASVTGSPMREPSQCSDVERQVGRRDLRQGASNDSADRLCYVGAFDPVGV